MVNHSASNYHLFQGRGAPTELTLWQALAQARSLMTRGQHHQDKSYCLAVKGVSRVAATPASVAARWTCAARQPGDRVAQAVAHSVESGSPAQESGPGE